MFTLKTEDYSKVYKLLKGNERYDVVLNAVLTGNTRGVVYVENQTNPRSALVYAVGLSYYLVGDPNNQLFLKQLTPSFMNHLKEESLHLCGGTWFCSTFFQPHWEDTLVEKNRGRELFQGEKIYFELTRDNDHLLKIPSNYRLEKLTTSILFHYKDLKDEIQEYWGSIDSFLISGFGYAISEGSQVYSVCYSCSVWQNEHELSVVTYDEKKRKQNLATIVTRAHLRECLIKGVQPRWTTDNDNIASIRLAQKIGFTERFRAKGLDFHF